MLRVAAFAGGGLEFLGTLSARLFVLYAQRTVVPVNQGVQGGSPSRLHGGGVSVTADAAKTLDQRSLREALVYGVNRKFMGRINR